MSWASSIAFVFALPLLFVASLEVPDVISSNMVLQRDPLAARLWGYKEPPDQTISIKLDDVEVGTTASDSDGNWLFELAPQQASTGRRITISSTTGESVEFENVAFGDVYLCSGQSNMEMAVNAVENATEEIADSVNYPNLRFFHLHGMVAQAENPNPIVMSKAREHNWMESQPSMFPTGKDVFLFPSAACYFFGRDLYKGLGGDVPIGFVSSTWSNMPIQVFMSPDALADATCGGTQNANSLQAKDCTELMASQFEREQGRVEMQASQVWFGSIYPLLHMRISAVLWYQGESNADDPVGYTCLFPSMIADWRGKFDLPDLEFYFVQVSTGYLPWGSTLSPDIREAQLSGLLLDGTTVIPSYDLGEPALGIKSRSWPLGSLHPRRKQELGRRLALAVQKVHYHAEVVATGPVFEEFGRDAGSGKLFVAYAADTSEGLHFRGTPDCTVCCDASPFEVRASNGTWLQTTEHVIIGNKVMFGIDSGFAGTLDTVAYANAAMPECGLYNGDGGPDDHAGIVALPFVKIASVEFVPTSSGAGLFTRSYSVSDSLKRTRLRNRDALEAAATQMWAVSRHTNKLA